MRIWSIHPAQLDRAALIAGWREGLLAQKVLRGETKGYRHHPQLQRFRALPDPVAGIAAYLHALADEADARGYRFDRTRVVRGPAPIRLEVTDGQLGYEWSHLLAKVAARAPEWHAAIKDQAPRAHPMFAIVKGGIEAWERRPETDPK